MPLTTEEGLQDNIDCGTDIILDNDNVPTGSAALLNRP